MQTKIVLLVLAFLGWNSAFAAGHAAYQEQQHIPVATAVARMCMDRDNREALESTGIKCPQRRGSGRPMK